MRTKPSRSLNALLPIAISALAIVAFLLWIDFSIETFGQQSVTEPVESIQSTAPVSKETAVFANAELNVQFEYPERWGTPEVVVESAETDDYLLASGTIHRIVFMQSAERNLEAPEIAFYSSDVTSPTGEIRTIHFPLPHFPATCSQMKDNPYFSRCREITLGAGKAADWYYAYSQDMCVGDGYRQVRFKWSSTDFPNVSLSVGGYYTDSWYQKATQESELPADDEEGRQAFCQTVKVVDMVADLANGKTLTATTSTEIEAVNTMLQTMKPYSIGHP